jgi:type I restriction enzyme S subunit
MAVNKGFKQTEIGLIPSDWEVKTIIELALNRKELFDDGDWVEAEHIQNQGIRLIQTGNIGIGRFHEKGVKKFINQDSFDILKCKELLVGDVLICRLAEPAGRACIFPNTQDERTITSVDVTIFRPPANVVDRQYLNQIFTSNKWLSSVSENSGGTTHKRISRGKLGKIKISIPNISEQKAIATALSDMDELIAQTEKLIEKKKAIKQGVMQELLRPKEGWVVKKFTDVVDYIHGKAHEQYIVEDGKYKVVNSKFISSDGEVVKYSNTSFLTAKENDILTVLSDLPNGKALAKCFLVDQNNLYAVNQRICIWRTKGADPLYLYYILNRHAHFLQLDDGVTQTHILNGDINKFELSIIEDVQKQREIGIILRDIDNEINILENKNGKLQLQKKGMMQALLTGKIRLV